MALLTKISEWIIKKSFNLSVWLIEQFHDMNLYDEQLSQLRQLENGTLGKEIATCLGNHKLRLVPHYESHDLKHSLLDFKMTPIDEIRMQAFMIGNGNLSIPSIAIFTFGFILLPSQWIQFSKDFRAGLNSKSIKTWTIQEYAEQDLNQLRKKVINADKMKINMDSIMKKLVYSGSIFSMLAGGLGMLYCLPYLFSPVLEDLVGAGFPFVGGAILFMGGLISLSMFTKRVKTSYNIN